MTKILQIYYSVLSEKKNENRSAFDDQHLTKLWPRVVVAFVFFWFTV